MCEKLWTESVAGRFRRPFEESERAAVARMLELDAEGRSLREIAAVLTAEGVPTKRGGTWASMTVKKILDRAA